MLTRRTVIVQLSSALMTVGCGRRMLAASGSDRLGSRSEDTPADRGVRDGDEIQAAIDRAAAAGGGTVNVTPGRHLLTVPLHLPGGVELLGGGAATVLALASDSTSESAISMGAILGRGGAVLTPGRHAHPTLRNLVVEGNGPQPIAHGQLIMVSDADAPLIEDIAVRKARGGGIILERTTGAVLRRVVVESTGQDGISFYLDNDGGSIEDCIARDTGDDGFAFVCYGTPGAHGHPTNCRATRCTADHTGIYGGGAGFKIAGATDTTLQDCVTQGASTAGFQIQVGVGEGCPTSGVVIRNGSASGSGWLQDAPPGVPRNALFVGGGSGDVRVEGVTLDAGARAAIQVQGSRNVVLTGIRITVDAESTDAPVVDLFRSDSVSLANLDASAVAESRALVRVDAQCTSVELSESTVPRQRVRAAPGASIRWTP